MTASTTIHPHGLGRRTIAGMAAAIAVAGGAAIALTDGGDAPRGPSAATALSPESQRYVDWVVSATPEELAAALGYGRLARTAPPVESGTAVR